MTRNELAEELARQGVAQDAYSLGDKPQDERYCLERHGSQWAVFYFERGHYRDQVVVPTEGEACDALLRWILEDETTRSVNRRTGDW